MSDPKFQEYVFRQGYEPALQLHWQQIRDQFPEQVSVMQEAEEMLKAFRQQALTTDPEGEWLVWQEVKKVLDVPTAVKRRILRRPALAAAWIGLALLIGGWLCWHILSHQQAAIVTTADEKGAFKLVKLPDSSQVMLGANSDIRYQPSWNRKGPREVWLNGDAHFEVKHLNKEPQRVTEREKFLVHVNDVEIEVLGTVFNVWNRNGKTEVELESGKVKLRMKDTGKEMILRPGEVATISGRELELNEEKSDLVLQGPAHDKLYELNNTSVAEIIKMIAGTYGKKVVVEDTALLSRRIDGVLPLCHEKDLLFALSGILDIRVRQTDALTWVFSTAE